MAKAEQRAPSLPPHYTAFHTTTGCSVPALRIGTLALAVGAACGFSLRAVGATEHRFSRSIRKPELRAAYMPDVARAVSGIPRADPGGKGHPPVLTSPNPLSTLLQRFACARLSRPRLPKSCSGVSATLPSRPGEFHPEPLTDPDVTLSCHPARATARRLPPSVENLSSSRYRLALSQRR